MGFLTYHRDMSARPSFSFSTKTLEDEDENENDMAEEHPSISPFRIHCGMI